MTQAVTPSALRAPFTLLLLLAVAACGGLAPAQPGQPREPAAAPTASLYHNGTILTLEPDQPVAGAILVRDGIIAGLGTVADLQPQLTPGTQVIDLNGLTLMPGFVDAHTHILNDARAQNMSLDQAQALALRNGITTIGDLYVDRSFLATLQAFDRHRFLRLRASLYLVYTDPCGNRLGDWWTAYPATSTPGEMLRMGGVKIFADGGSCGRVALSFDHADQHGGDLWFSQDELDSMVLAVQAAGRQAAIHAIGDRAVAQAQAAIAAAIGDGPNTLRHRMEHNSVIAPELLARYGQLGIIPVIPGQYPSCRPFGPPLDEAYGAWEWPWGELQTANPGLSIAWHSDYPFQSINPFVHLYGFVTRNDVFQHYTCKPQTWLRDDTLSVERALSIMTLESAYALFRETEVGSLRPGKYADFIIVSDNPLTVGPEDLRRIGVLVTVVGGSVEYCNPRYGELCPNFTPRTPAALPDYRPPVPARWLVIALTVIAPLIFGLWRFRGAIWAARFGAYAALLGGLLWMVAWWLGADDWAGGRWAFLTFVASASFACAAAGLSAVGRPGRVGLAGLALAWLAAIGIGVSFGLSFWLEYEAAWWLILVSLLAHTLGLAVYGLANLKAKVLKRFNGLPLVVGLVSGPIPVSAILTIAQSAEWPSYGIVFGLGIGWVLLGGLMLGSNPPAVISRPRGQTSRAPSSASGS